MMDNPLLDKSFLESFRDDLEEICFLREGLEIALIGNSIKYNGSITKYFNDLKEVDTNLWEVLIQKWTD